jgi:hypothetical protein
MYSIKFGKAFELQKLPGLLFVRFGQRHFQIETWCALRDLRSWDWFFETEVRYSTRRAIVGPFELCTHRAA